jgi:hypothetical protein
MTTMLQLRGTCPACFGEFQLHDDSGKTVVGKHGWQEVGGRQVGVYHQAFHEGECFGFGWQPFELSPDGTWAFVNQILFPSALSEQSWIHRLTNETPDLMVQVRRGRELLTIVLTPTNEEGTEEEGYNDIVNGRVEYVYGTAYEAERRRRLARAQNILESLMRRGAELCEAASGWKLADLKDGSPKGPTVHLKREGARLPYCGSRSHGLRTTMVEEAVSCTWCTKALEAEKARLRAKEALEKDAETLTAYLRTNGPRTKSDLKTGLGWDAKRVNRAIDQAERPWRDGKTQPGTICSIYNYPKPERFEALPE